MKNRLNSIEPVVLAEIGGRMNFHRREYRHHDVCLLSRIVRPASSGAASIRRCCPRMRGILRGLRTGLLCTTLLTFALLGNGYHILAQGQSLPVYHVDQFGATPAQAAMLSSALNIPPSPPTTNMGVVHYLDYTNYLAVPTVPLTDTNAISLLLGQTMNENPGIPIQLQQIDFGALSNLVGFD